MISPKLLELVEALREQSGRGLVPWGETAQENEFMASFPSYSVTISRSDEPRATGRAVRFMLKLFNERGMLIQDADYLEPDPTSQSQDPLNTNLREIFVSARTRALGGDKAIDEIVSLLKMASPWRFILEPNVGRGSATWPGTSDKRPNIWRGIGFTKSAHGSIYKVLQDDRSHIVYGPYKFDPPLMVGRYLVRVKGQLSYPPTKPVEVPIPLAFEITHGPDDKLGSGPAIASLESVETTKPQDGFLFKLEFDYAQQRNLEFRIWPRKPMPNMTLNIAGLYLSMLSP